MQLTENRHASEHQLTCADCMPGQWQWAHQWAKGKYSCCLWCSPGTWPGHSVQCHGNHSPPSATGYQSNTSEWWYYPSHPCGQKEVRNPRFQEATNIINEPHELSITNLNIKIPNPFACSNQQAPHPENQQYFKGADRIQGWHCTQVRKKSRQGQFLK